jgi:hypothetical protein
MIFAAKLEMGGDQISGDSGASEIDATNSSRLLLVGSGMPHDREEVKNSEFMLLYDMIDAQLRFECESA